MANRKNTFLLKRSNIAGKIPSSGDLLLGELALNTADNILYASGTTANSILPIGWDRVARTGDTVTGDFNFFGDVKISGSSLPNGYALSVTGDTNFIGDVYVTGDLTYNGSLLVTGGTVIQSGLTANTIYTDYIDFNTNYTPTQQVGRIHWDVDYGTLDVDLEGNNINLKIGLDNLYYIKNQSGSTINKGRVVRAAGTLGTSGRILGEYMIADGSIPYYYTLGIAGENILDGEDGYVYEFGLIKGIDTTGSLYGESWSGGTILYVHPTIAGGLTSIEPTEPNFKIQIGIVIKSDSNGSIFVRPSLGYNLGDLHDLQTSGQTNGDLISYDSSNGYWGYSKTLNGSYTITGDTTVGGQMKATTMSATTYLNLPIDVRVTGGTYSSGTATFTNNTGGTFTVTGFSDGGGSVFTGGTVTGATNFINGLTANTFNIGTIGSGTSINNLGIDVDGNVVVGESGGGSGEVNTASNIGGGIGIFSGKSGVDLQFKTLTSTGGTIAITSTGSTINLESSSNGNAVVDNFYYQISNSVDTRPIFEDDNVLFNWDETGNDLEFQMKVAPSGTGDMRASAYLLGGSVQSTAIVATGVNYDVYGAGVSAGNRLDVFISAENDESYPAYRVIVFNTGESSLNTIWIERITKK